MSKTPVSVLQEYMTKRNIIPSYELLSSSEGIGTHIPTFFYKVTTDSVQAIGKGRSKKEAKHEAARVALEKLNELGLCPEMPNTPASPIHSTTPDPNSPQKIQVNAIGALADLCAEKNIPMPNYQLTADVGPAHLRQFTIECSVATMTVTSTDLTKKKARQNAAQKMLHRLIDTLPEVIEEMSLGAGMNNDLKAIEASDSIIKTYNELSMLNKKKTNWGMKISDYPKTIKNIMEEKDLTYKDLWQEDINFDSIQLVLDKLDLHIFEETIEEEPMYLTLIALDSDPEFVASGTGTTEGSARWSAMQQMLEFLQIMTK